MPNPGGREAEIEAALRAFDDAAAGGFDALRDEEWPRRAMRAALDAVRSSGSAAQEEGLEVATRIIFGTPTQNSQRQLVGEAVAAYLAASGPDAQDQDRPKVPKIAAKREGEYGLEIDFEAVRSPQSEDHEMYVCDWNAKPHRFCGGPNKRSVPVRSPQSEDHEEKPDA